MNLAEGCARANDYETLEVILGMIYSYKLDLSLIPGLIKAILGALNWVIDPVY